MVAIEKGALWSPSTKLPTLLTNWGNKKTPLISESKLFNTWPNPWMFKDYSINKSN